MKNLIKFILTMFILSNFFMIESNAKVHRIDPPKSAYNEDSKEYTHINMNNIIIDDKENVFNEDLVNDIYLYINQDRGIYSISTEEKINEILDLTSINRNIFYNVKSKTIYLYINKTCVYSEEGKDYININDIKEYSDILCNKIENPKKLIICSIALIMFVVVILYFVYLLSR